MTTYQGAILSVVRSIPPGKIMSYGQVAAYVGTPRAARQVGWAMHSLSDTPDFPWWRVLNAAGHISIKESWDTTPQVQQHYLEQEGVEFKSDLKLDIERYRYRPNEGQLKQFQLDPDYIKTVLAKYDIG
jgi:methylated-DNA-protein-cysteine methyltransferase-like protein